MSLPPIPRTLPSPLGTIAVRRSRKLKSSDGAACLGICHWDTLEIEVDAALSGATAWATLFHEYTHMLLFNAALNVALSKEAVESVCDVVGTGMTNLLVRKVLVRPKKPRKRRA